ATLNGASWTRKVLDVALPSVRPLLLAITMLLIGLSLGTFDGVLILTGGGPGTSTVTPALYSYNQAFGVNDWPTGAASAWLIAAGVNGAGVGGPRGGGTGGGGWGGGPASGPATGRA